METQTVLCDLYVVLKNLTYTPATPLCLGEWNTNSAKNWEYNLFNLRKKNRVTKAEKRGKVGHYFLQLFHFEK